MRVFDGRWSGRWLVLLVVLTGLAAVGRGSAAFAADSIYWSDNLQAGTIHVGNLDGSGTPQVLYTGAVQPAGVALDPAAGKIYWANDNGASIGVGNLDGSGTAQTMFSGQYFPVGVATDPTDGKIYWANYGGAVPGEAVIREGNLDGSGTPRTLFSESRQPYSVAIDPADGKIYWNEGNGGIRVANLDGSGTPQVLYDYTTMCCGSGLAIDPAAGKVYWTTNSASHGTIEVANLDGSGTPQTLFTTSGGAGALAIDPNAGKIYWPDFGGIWVGNIDGSGTPHLLFGETNVPSYLALLRAPAPAAVPQITGGPTVGSLLSCSEGSWAPDLVGSFLYRAPQSFSYQWSLNAVAIPGATSSSYTARTIGSYGCQVTASNHAGSGTEASATYAVFPTLSTSIRTRQALVVGRVANIRLACAAGSHGSVCRGELEFTIRERVRYHRQMSLRTLVLGRASYVLQTGDSKTIRLRLTATALRLLEQASRHTLNVRARATLQGGRTTVGTIGLRLK